jgi:hypothetical protein
MGEKKCKHLTEKEERTIDLPHLHAHNGNMEKNTQANLSGYNQLLAPSRNPVPYHTYQKKHVLE